MLDPMRESVVREMEKLAGTPYVWAAKGDRIGELNPKGYLVFVPTEAMCFDCSGAVGWALEHATAARGLRENWNTDSYWNRLPAVSIPQPGDLALYGGTRPDDVSHIEMVVKVTGAGAEVMGASGGDQRTTSIQAAKLRGAMVRRKSTHIYRRDFRGFRSIEPFLGVKGL